MIIILTGADGTGKTTLFNKLKKQIKHSSFISEPYPGPSTLFRNIRYTHLKDFVYHRNLINVVYDRSTVIDDIIYQPIIEKSDSIFLQEIQQVQATLSNCVIIHLQADKYKLHDRLIPRGDAYISISQLDHIEKAYQSFFQKMNLNVHSIDTTDLSPHQVSKHTIKIIKEITDADRTHRSD